MPARPASITDDLVARTDKMIDQVVKLADDLRAAGKDCKKATAAITAVAKDIRPVVDEVEKLTDKDDAAEDWMEARYEPKLEAAMKDDPFLEAGKACEKDKAFVDAMKSLGMFEAKRMDDDHEGHGHDTPQDDPPKPEK
jgi:hypothetical protein